MPTWRETIVAKAGSDRSAAYAWTKAMSSLVIDYKWPLWVVGETKKLFQPGSGSNGSEKWRAVQSCKWKSMITGLIKNGWVLSPHRPRIFHCFRRRGRGRGRGRGRTMDLTHL